MEEEEEEMIVRAKELCKERMLYMVKRGAPSGPEKKPLTMLEREMLSDEEYERVEANDLKRRRMY